MTLLNKNDQDHRSYDDTNNARRVTLVSSEAGGLINFEYDYVGESEPDSSTEVYAFKTGGSGGTLVATITVVYEDSTKARFVSATKVTP